MTDKPINLPSDAELIGRYIALRDKIAAMNAVHEEKLKPYAGAMETIANVLQGVLNIRGADSTKTEAGTAYLSTTHRVSVADRDALVKHVLETGNLALFSNALSKEAVEDFMDTHEGVLPPGVNRVGFTKVNVRKS